MRLCLCNLVFILFSTVCWRYLTINWTSTSVYWCNRMVCVNIYIFVFIEFNASSSSSYTSAASLYFYTFGAGFYYYTWSKGRRSEERKEKQYTVVVAPVFLFFSSQQTWNTICRCETKQMCLATVCLCAMSTISGIDDDAALQYTVQKSERKKTSANELFFNVHNNIAAQKKTETKNIHLPSEKKKITQSVRNSNTINHWKFLFLQTCFTECYDHDLYIHTRRETSTCPIFIYDFFWAISHLICLCIWSLTSSLWQSASCYLCFSIVVILTHWAINCNL